MSHSALRASAKATASRRSAAGVMPERIGRWSTGMARRYTKTVSKELFSTTSSFFVCWLLHQTSTQYSEAEKTRGGDSNGLRCGSPGGSDEATYQGDSRCCFRDIFSRCCLKVGGPVKLHSKERRCCLELCGLPSTMTLSSRLAYRLLRWNEEDMVFATLSFWRQFLR